jgi:two-component system, OmpR family, alkaline phosphatase synthesis response regulator PhoP
LKVIPAQDQNSASSYLNDFGAKMNRKKVLVVEDDSSIIVFVMDTLEYLGYEVSIARNGKEGLNKTQALIPDLIILDVMMPEMDGFEVCERLKTDENTKNIPILMLTARGQIQDKVKGFGVGADDYLAKPFEKEEFEARVKSLLRRPTIYDPMDRYDQSCRIFLSYARADAAIVEKIYENLSKNYSPWMDVHNILGGEDWLHAIYSAIDTCELFVPILSNNSVTRRGIIVKEVKRALDKWNGMLPSDIYVIPLRIDDCPIPELVKHLQVIEWDEGKGVIKLSQAIHVAIRRKSQW